MIHYIDVHPLDIRVGDYLVTGASAGARVVQALGERLPSYHHISSTPVGRINLVAGHRRVLFTGRAYSGSTIFGRYEVGVDDEDARARVFRSDDAERRLTWVPIDDEGGPRPGDWVATHGGDADSAPDFWVEGRYHSEHVDAKYVRLVRGRRIDPSKTVRRETLYRLIETT